MFSGGQSYNNGKRMSRSLAKNEMYTIADDEEDEQFDEEIDSDNFNHKEDASKKKRRRKTLPDNTERRRQQNRAAQKTFRIRKLAYLADLEMKASRAQSDRERCFELVSRLVQDNNDMKKALGQPTSDIAKWAAEKNLTEQWRELVNSGREATSSDQDSIASGSSSVPSLTNSGSSRQRSSDEDMASVGASPLSPISTFPHSFSGELPPFLSTTSERHAQPVSKTAHLFDITTSFGLPAFSSGAELKLPHLQQRSSLRSNQYLLGDDLSIGSVMLPSLFSPWEKQPYIESSAGANGKDSLGGFESCDSFSYFPPADMIRDMQLYNTTGDADGINSGTGNSAPWKSVAPITPSAYSGLGWPSHGLGF